MCAGSFQARWRHVSFPDKGTGGGRLVNASVMTERKLTALGRAGLEPEEEVLELPPVPASLSQGSWFCVRRANREDVSTLKADFEAQGAHAGDVSTSLNADWSSVCGAGSCLNGHAATTQTKGPSKVRPAMLPAAGTGPVQDRYRTCALRTHQLTQDVHQAI